MKIILSSILLVFLLSGCAKLAHMQELLVLKRYSENKDVQARYVDEQDQKFKELLNVVQNGEIEEYATQKKIQRFFGDPVFVKKITKDEKDLELWLYRYAVRYFDSPKVYLYFDEGKLYDWERYAPENSDDVSCLIKDEE